MFVGEMDYGVFTAMAGVRGDTTAASIVEFETEIRRYAEDGIQGDELAFTRNAIGQRDALLYETPRQKLAFLSRIQTYGLDDDFVDQQNAILKSIPAEELNAIAAKHLAMDGDGHRGGREPERHREGLGNARLRNRPPRRCGEHPCRRLRSPSSVTSSSARAVAATYMRTSTVQRRATAPACS